MSSISLSDFISCQSTKNPFIFLLNHPLGIFYALAIHTQISRTAWLPQLGTWPRLPREEPHKLTAGPPGSTGNNFAPACTSSPHLESWSMSDMSESAWLPWQGPRRDRGGKQRRGRQGGYWKHYCHHFQAQPALSLLNGVWNGRHTIPVNHHSPCPGWHIGCPGHTSRLMWTATTVWIGTWGDNGGGHPLTGSAPMWTSVFSLHSPLRGWIPSHPHGPSVPLRLSWCWELSQCKGPRVSQLDSMLSSKP